LKAAGQPLLRLPGTVRVPFLHKSEGFENIFNVFKTLQPVEKFFSTGCRTGLEAALWEFWILRSGAADAIPAGDRRPQGAVVGQNWESNGEKMERNTCHWAEKKI